MCPMKSSLANVIAGTTVLILTTLVAACGSSASGAGTGMAPPSSCGTAIGNAAAVPPETYTRGSQVQAQLAANPANRQQLFGLWEQDRWNAIGARIIETFSSSDGGLSWSPPSALPFSNCGASTGPGAGYDRASDPSIVVGTDPSGNRTVVTSALAFSAGGFLAATGTSAVLASCSHDLGHTWQTPVAVIADTNQGAGPYHFDDRDALAADPNSSAVYLAWDQLSSDNSASMPTLLARSSDGGCTWSSPAIIYSPGAASQTFNNQMLVLPNGHVVDIFTQLPTAASFAVNQLVAIRSVDKGVTWTPNPGVVIAAIAPVGTANPVSGGPPIRDSANLGQTAVDPLTGHLAVVWQDSSPASNSNFDGIFFSQSIDEGLTWSAPVQVNSVATVAAFEPSVQYGANGRNIAITYYDFRDYVAGSDALSTGLWLRTSADGGLTWSADTRLAGPFDLNLAPPADLVPGTTGNARFLGDQQGLAWNGSNWTALFSAVAPTGTAGTFGARINWKNAP